MLLQHVARALFALLVARPFRRRATKARPVALGLLRRAIPLGAFPESFQIDGFPHDQLHHPKSWYGTATAAPRQSSSALPIDSICIKNIPHRLKQSRQLYLACESGIFLCFADYR